MTKLSFACGLVLSTAVATWSSVSMAAPTAATAAAPTAATAAPAGITTPAAATAAAAPKTPKLVCESVSEAGSHMKKRVCLTPEQMAQRHKDSQQAAQDLQNRARQLNSEGKPPG
ncbi:MAG TPA: hypothetical protein VH327_07995 [Gammaproteobacteria bacterium]|jgi:hypothetical protein|nr:hypothetical protein [Gammaproteobacteria bacterium]